jgi:hypothetical protein
MRAQDYAKVVKKRLNAVGNKGQIDVMKSFCSVREGRQAE